MKINIYITLAFTAAVLLAGCGKDFLTEEPKLTQSDALTLSTFEGLDKSMAGSYAPLASIDWYGGDFILSNEIRTMNGKRWFDIKKYNSGRYDNDYKLVFTSESTSGVWGLAYYITNSVNSVFEHLDKVSGDEKAKNNIKAEGLFLRALSLFDAVRTYAQPYGFTADASHLGVPIVLNVDPLAKPARSTVKEVYDRIIADLTEAEKIIDPKYVRAGLKDDAASVRLEAIQALLSRVYLYSNQWQKAADYATKVIDSGKFKMWEADKVAKIYQEDVPKGGEVIFEVYMNTSQTYGTGNLGVWGLTWYDGYGDCGASNDLKALYEGDDVRSKLVVSDKDGIALFTKKYAGKGMASIDANNVIVLRLSEMYLNRAEASLHGATTPSSAANDIKAVASKRNATPSSASLEGVYTERNKELAWEGHLWFDLARTGRSMTRVDVTEPNIPTLLKAKDFRWAMPIPKGEFGVNENLVQNEGYK